MKVPEYVPFKSVEDEVKKKVEERHATRSEDVRHAIQLSDRKPHC
jgi:hypothetical protein